MMNGALTPTVLDEQSKNVILEQFRKNTQSYRIVEYLSDKPKVPTGELNASSATGNISQIANTCINPKIEILGYRIACEKPLNPIYNKFGQQSLQHVWSLCRIGELH